MIHRSTLLVLAHLIVLGSALPGAAKNFSAVASAVTTIAQAQTNSDSSPQAETLDKRDVLDLQVRLQSLGYYNQAVDGIYGQDTVEALKRFQADAGLPVTGVVDATTLDQLQNPQLLSSIEAPSDAQTTDGSVDPTSETPETTATEEPDATIAEIIGEGADGESENPPNEASNSTDGDPSTADPDNQSASSEGEVSTNSGNTPEQAGDNGVRWLLWLVLAAAAIASLGGGLIVATRSGQAQAEDDDAQDDEDDIDARTASINVKVNSSQTGVFPTNLFGKTPKVSPPPTQSSPLPSTNGHKPSETKPEVKTPISSNSLSNQTGQTTRIMPRLDVVEALVEDLQSTTPAKRKRAIWELGQRGSSVALQPLVNLLLDADSKERSLILAAVSEISTRSLKPMNQALAIALQDPNPEVRKNAIRDITRVYDLTAQAAQMLAHVQTDSDPEVQATARWALGQLGRLRTIAMQEGQPALPDVSIPASDFLPEESHKQS